MTIGISVLLVIVWLHFFGDFIFQSDKMAKNKSKSNLWLLFHVTTYSVCWIGFGWKFALITFVCHFITDWITSRGTSYLWQKNKVHWFFSLIGFDQAIHLTTLILTYKLLFRK